MGMKLKLVSGLMLALLLVSMLHSVFDVSVVVASGTIYIRADGSIDPPTAPITTADNVTYTLTDNITSSGATILAQIFAAAHSRTRLEAMESEIHPT